MPHEALLMLALTFVAASLYTRVKWLDLSVGFWAVLAPWIFLGIAEGRLTVADWRLWACAVAAALQCAMPALFARQLLRHRELYAIASFFVALALRALAAGGLTPNFSSLLPAVVADLSFALWGSAFLALYCATLFFSRPAARMSFYASRDNLHGGDRLAIALSQLAGIVAACLVGILFKEGHQGLIAKAEQISLLSIVCVALVRPASVLGSAAAAMLAFFAVIASQAMNNAIPVLPSGFDYIETMPLVLIALAVTLFTLRSFGRPPVTSPAQLLPILTSPRPNTSLAIAAIVGIFGIVIMEFIPAVLGPFHNSAMLLGFGLLVILLRALTGVVSIFAGVYSYGVALVLISIAIRHDGSLQIGYTLAILIAAIAVFTAYFDFLRKQDASHQVLYDLIATFSLSSVASSFFLLSGAESYASLDPSGAFSGSRFLGVATLLLAVCGLLLIPWLIDRAKAAGHGRLIRKDLFAEFASLPSFAISPLHGYSSLVQLTLVCAPATLIALVVTFSNGLRTGHLDAHDYTLTAAIQALAIGMVSIGARHLGWSVLLALALGFILARTAGWGEQIGLLYGAAGIFVVVVHLLNLSEPPSSRAVIA